MLPLTIKEIRRQRSVIEFYNNMEKNKIGEMLYEHFKQKGLRGLTIYYAKNKRDLFLELEYTDKPETKQEVYITPFDAFGSSQYAPHYKNFMRSYFTRMFGEEYTNICKQYDEIKKRNKLYNYNANKNLALENWDKL